MCFPNGSSEDRMSGGDTFSFPTIALDAWKLVNNALCGFLGWAAMGAEDVLNTEIGGFFIGESVVNVSACGGGIDILAKEFLNTRLGKGIRDGY